HAQSMIEIRAVQAAILDEQVAHAARNLASDGDAAVTIFHSAPPNDDVLARHFEPPPIGVSPRFDRDAVIARIEEAILDQDIGTRFGLATIIVRPVTDDLHPAHSDVRAKDRMDLPHW